MSQTPSLGWEDGKYRWAREGENIAAYIPHFLIYRNHPAVRDPRGVAYVYEGCPELLLYYCRFFPSLQIPMSVDDDVLKQAGLLELQPRMYILYRDVRKSRDPNDDLLKMWVTDECEVATACTADVEDAKKARDKLIGDKDKAFGGQKKGTHLERSGRGHGNGQGDRCLTYMQSIEAQRGIAHPPGNMSQAFTKGDETLTDLRDYQKVTT